MRAVLSFFLLVVACFSLSTTAHAQSDYEGPKFSPREVKEWEKRSAYATEKFAQLREELFAAIYAGEDDDFDRLVRQMRSYYPLLPSYDPFSDSVIERLTQLAFQIDQPQSFEDVAAAKLEYDKLINERIVDLSVLLFASDMARLNPKLGDVDRFEKIIASTRNIFVHKGKGAGLNPDRAYEVVTYADETFLLAMKRVEVIKSELFEVYGNHYNVHYVRDKEGNEFEVYMDVSQSIRNVQMQKFIASRQVTPSDLLIFQ